MDEKPIGLSYCGIHLSGGDGYWLVELLVNGESVTGRTFVRGHSRDATDQSVVTGQIKALLKDGDEISVRITPIQTSSFRLNTYAARGSQCSLTIQKLRHFQ